MNCHSLVIKKGKRESEWYIDMIPLYWKCSTQYSENLYYSEKNRKKLENTMNPYSIEVFCFVNKFFFCNIMCAYTVNHTHGVYVILTISEAPYTDSKTQTSYFENLHPL